MSIEFWISPRDENSTISRGNNLFQCSGILQWKPFLISVFWFVPVPQSCHCALPWRVWLWLYQWQLPITHPILVLHQDFGLVLVKLWGSWHLISWEFQLPLIMPSSISFIPWLDITGRLAVGEFRIIQVINRDVKQMINSYWFPEGTQWETRQHSVFMVT